MMEGGQGRSMGDREEMNEGRGQQCYHARRSIHLVCWSVVVQSAHDGCHAWLCGSWMSERRDGG